MEKREKQRILKEFKQPFVLPTITLLVLGILIFNSGLTISGRIKLEDIATNGGKGSYL